MSDQITWRLPEYEPHRVAETPAEYVIFRPKLYVDATIPSYLTARPSRDPLKLKRQQITREWWDLYRWQFTVYWSDQVLDEADRGDKIAARRRIESLEPFSRLTLDTGAKALANTFMRACQLPESTRTDATHVAIAATHDTQYLLTWNCTHLANRHLASKMMDICFNESYACPTILTPEQIMRVPTHERQSNP